MQFTSAVTTIHLHLISPFVTTGHVCLAKTLPKGNLGHDNCIDHGSSVLFSYDGQMPTPVHHKTPEAPFKRQRSDRGNQATLSEVANVVSGSTRQILGAQQGQCAFGWAGKKAAGFPKAVNYSTIRWGKLLSFSGS